MLFTVHRPYLPQRPNSLPQHRYFLRGSDSDLRIVLFRLLQIYRHVEASRVSVVEFPIDTPRPFTVLFHLARYVVQTRTFLVWFVCIDLNVLDA